MPFRICKTFEIESGHMLSKHLGNCRFPHGHSRRVEIVVVSKELNAADMVCDFKALKAALDPFLAQWDHALCLNTADPQFAYLEKTYGARVVPFANADPTSERMAQVIFAEAKRRLHEASGTVNPSLPISAAVRVERVRVTETSSSWAEYFE
jgi:6-pyruvoyltetrahydropterin/6-carboxytetrahydropterin synthase